MNLWDDLYFWSEDVSMPEAFPYGFLWRLENLSEGTVVAKREIAFRTPVHSGSILPSGPFSSRRVGIGGVLGQGFSKTISRHG